MFPTLACGVEQGLRDDIPATMATLRAFNRWLEEDWGFAYHDRIFARADAVAGRPRRRARGARLAARARRAHGAHPAGAGADGRTAAAGRSAIPRHDPVWARLAEASMPVAFHLGDSGYEAFVGRVGRQRTVRAVPAASTCSAKLVVSDRPIHDTIGSMVVDGVFDRHPTLRVASIENGSDWVHLLVKRLRKQANQTPWVFPTDPLETIQPPRVGHAVLRGGHPQARRHASASTGCCSAPTGPTARGWPTPLDFVKELARVLRRRGRRRSCATTCSTCSVRSRRVSDTGRAERRRRRAARRRVDTGSRSNWDPDLTVAEWWGCVGAAGWTAPHFPHRVGRPRLPRRSVGARSRRPSTSGARAAARRPRAAHGRADDPARHGTPEQIDRLVAADLRRRRSRGASCSASRAPAPTSPV